MRNRRRLRNTTLFGAVAGMLAAGMVFAPSANADAFRCGHSGSDPRAWCAYVKNAPSGLKARTGPGTSYSVRFTLGNGTKVEVDCWTYGTSVNGYNIWAGLYNPIARTYVSDYYLSTGRIQNYVSRC
ncbi:SH3 domain-containing protein [Streptomyces sparsus]